MWEFIVLQLIQAVFSHAFLYRPCPTLTLKSIKTLSLSLSMADIHNPMIRLRFHSKTCVPLFGVGTISRPKDQGPLVTTSLVPLQFMMIL